MSRMILNEVVGADAVVCTSFDDEGQQDASALHRQWKDEGPECRTLKEAVRNTQQRRMGTITRKGLVDIDDTRRESKRSIQVGIAAQEKPIPAQYEIVRKRWGWREVHFQGAATVSIGQRDNTRGSRISDRDSVRQDPIQRKQRLWEGTVKGGGHGQGAKSRSMSHSGGRNQDVGRQGKGFMWGPRQSIIWGKRKIPVPPAKWPMLTRCK
ncbi:hypothetical protein C8J57DRAFT_1235176 [Mycena rebaudengoi]|nr:hypothetical protein C8J57DRAFT_1235176 [Mycena rebaudengoi]